MSDRPETCCGVCPELMRGGYDCTCANNPRCPKNQPKNETNSLPSSVKVYDGGNSEWVQTCSVLLPLLGLVGFVIYMAVSK